MGTTSGDLHKESTMSRGLWASLVILTLAVPGRAGGEAGPKKPRLDVRASPRLGLAPARVLATAELVGGDAAEDFYCPLLEWDWDDGTKSVREADCPPYEAGAALERYFTADHVYRRSGNYSVRVVLRRASRSVAAASVSVGLR
jgi:hypothetical protein